MPRSRIWVISLALLTVALGAFVVFFERELPSTSELAARRGKWLATLVRERLASIEVERGEATVRLEAREGRRTEDELDRWRVSSPFADDADDEAVDMLLGALEWAVPRRRLEGLDAPAIAALALGAPRARVRLADRRGSSVGVAFFGEDPRAEGVYATVDGEEGVVFVVGKDVYEAIDHAADHFRAKELFGRFSMHRASRITIEDATGELQLERRGSNWSLRASGGESVASGDRIEGILTGLDEARATRFVAARPAGGRRVRVELGFGRAGDAAVPEAVQFVLGDACEGSHDERMVIVAESRPTACVPARFLDVLARSTADDLRLREDGP